MPIDKGTASDSTYHSRHSRRTVARASRIAEHIHAPGKLLDVGCNKGITSRFMLDSGNARHVTGIELQAKTVEPDLLKRDGFQLIAGNIVNLKLEEKYDHIIYGAVHHHILNLFGLSSAIHTLQKLISNCNKHLFFETGQLGEGGRWGWHAPMRREFRTDEEHFFYILRSVEHLISGFEVIGSFWIHGIRRHYLRIDIKPVEDVVSLERFIAWPKYTRGPFARSRGQHKQCIYETKEPEATDSPSHFWVSDSGDRPLFIKKHAHLTIAATAEFSLGAQIDKPWAVQPVAYVETFDTLAFPYIRDALPIRDFSNSHIKRRCELAAQVVEIFRDARRLDVIVRTKVLLSSRSSARLVDIIDLNPNNILVTKGHERDIVRVVDFEFHGLHTSSRNRVHLARLLFLLRRRRAYAAQQFVIGWAGIFIKLVCYEVVPFAQRVIDRQPSLSSLIISDFRTVIGKVLRVLFRSFGRS